MSYGELIIILMLLVVICQRGIKLLTLKEIKKSMATKEDAQTLSNKLDSVVSAVENVAADTAALKEELKVTNENSNVDLTPMIAQAEALEARLNGIAGPNVGSDPEAPTEPGTEA